MALTQAQIQTAYQNALQRPPNASELNGFFAASQSGALSDAQIYSSISNSQEANNFVDPIVRTYQAAFGRVPDQAGLNQQVDTYNVNGNNLRAISVGFSQSTEFTTRYGTDPVVTEAYIQSLYVNILGRTGTGAEVQGWIDASRNPNSGYTTRGDILFGFAQSGEFITRSNSAVDSFLLSAAQGTATYSGPLFPNGGVVVTTLAPLTTGADTVNGGTGADSLTGVIDLQTPASATFTAADQINLGDGIDSLNVTVTGNVAGALPAATLSGVENFFIRDVGTGGAGTYNFGTFSGEQQVWTDRSTQAAIFTNVGSSLTAGTGATVGVKGDGTAAVGNLSFAYASLTDQVSIAADGGNTGSTTTITNTGASTATTASISSTGGTNTFGAVDLTASADVLTALNINAATSFTATLQDGDTINTGAALTITGAAARVSLGAGGEFKTIDASGLSAGGVTMTLDTFTTSFKGGAGNDFVTTNALTTTTESAIAAGGGTGDRIVVAATANVDTAVEAKLYAGFEVLETVAETVDLSLFTNSTINALRVGGNATFNNVTAAQASAVTVFASSAATFTVNGANTVGQIDTLGLTVDDGSAVKNTLTLGNITAAGVENISINAVDNATVTSLLGATALTGVTASGAGNVSITTGALALNVNTTFNASAVTGTVTLDASAATANGIALVGSSTAVNTLTGTGLNDALTGGSANDSLTGGVGLDTLTGGAGANTFVFANTSTGTPSATVFDTITDYRAGTANVIDFGAITLNTVAGGSGAAGQASVTANGLATFNAADTTLAQRLTAVDAAIVASGGAATAGESAIFQQGSDSYLFVSDATGGLTATDVLIKLTGLTVGANGLTITAGDITAIA